MRTFKTLLTVSLLLISSEFSFGQTTEINLNVFSGIFFFKGEGATKNSWINFNPYVQPNNYTTNPYGKRSGFSYAIEVQAQRVKSNKNIYGLGISFELLTTRVHIDTITENGIIYRQIPASGQTRLKNSFVTANPFVGHRYAYGKVNVDLLAGVDLALCLKVKESGKASSDRKTYIAVENNKAKPSLDFRPRIQIKAQVNKLAFLAGYSIGLTNYQSAGNQKAFSSFIRLGVSYRLK